MVKDELAFAAKPGEPNVSVQVPVEPEVNPEQLTLALVPAVLLAL